MSKTQNDKEWITSRIYRVFKDIFCGEDNQELLEKFLSRLLNKEVRVDLYLTNELKNESVNERRKAVDLLVKEDNEYILLELNNGYKEVMHFRNYIYFSSVISQKTGRIKKYDSNIKFLLINLTYGLPKSKDFKFKSYKLLSVDGKGEVLFMK